jgi:hypothetical protein
VIPHLQEQLFHVCQPKLLVPRPPVLVERLELAGGDFIELIVFSSFKKGAHLADELLGDLRRKLDGLTTLSEYVHCGGNCKSAV